MEDQNAIVGTPTSGDNPSCGLKSGCLERDTGHCGKEAGGVSMPICFLVKEQAKSVVAIQELQKRMDHFELVQEDVIDAILDLRGNLSGSRSLNSKHLSVPSPGSAQISKSPLLAGSITSPFPKGSQRFSQSLSSLKDVPVASRARSFSWNNCKTGIKENTASVVSSEGPQKVFDLVKVKDGAPESDKQDSGLDSDCPNDVLASLNKRSSNLPHCDSGDELLHLLDEISHKSEILQMQLMSVDENSTLVTLQEEMTKLQTDRHDLRQNVQDVRDERDSLKFKVGCLEKASGELVCKKQDLHRKFLTTLSEGYEDDNQEHVSFVSPPQKSGAGTSEWNEDKMTSCRMSKLRKTAVNKIDGAVVSSILKETNIVDLQRQVLIYLVENAVLHTKLNEMEHSAKSRNSASSEIENALKDEARLLMMENRELRISLDEQRLEVNALKSKLLVLERLLQTTTAENHELNWQLGEFYGLQNMRDRRNFSSSFTFGSSNNGMMKGRRASLPTRFANPQDANVTINKTKLLPNTSSYLDVTIEEDFNTAMESSFHPQMSPHLTSTPATYLLRRQKDGLSTSVKPSLKPFGSFNATYIQSARKRSKAQNCGENEPAHLQNSDLKNFNPEDGTSGSSQNCLHAPQFLKEQDVSENVSSKLKGLSDFRLPRAVPLLRQCESGDVLSDEKKVSLRGSSSRPKSTSVICEKDSTGLKAAPDKSPGSRKTFGNSRNLHQRIQVILDRITAETEEAGT